MIPAQSPEEHLNGHILMEEALKHLGQGEFQSAQAEALLYIGPKLYRLEKVIGPMSERLKNAGSTLESVEPELMLRDGA